MYAFPPSNAVRNQPWVFWRLFEYDELKTIVNYCELLPQVKASIGDGAVQGAALTDKRSSNVAWVKHSADLDWVFKRLELMVREVNEKHFGFDLWGFGEDFQYTVYDAERGEEHYSWHIDDHGPGRVARKLSFTLQLADPMDYEGGELWLWGQQRQCLSKELGLIHLFPSFTLHRVTPVTKGVRRSLVGWVSGPDWR